jgi:hypothetical protein
MKFLTSVILFATITFIRAESPPSQDTPKGKAEQFLSGIVAGDLEKSFDKLFAGSPTAAVKPEMVDLMKRQTSAGLPLYGKALRFEPVEERHLGASVVVLSYMLVMEKHPLIWHFFFYRPDKTWLTDTVFFNDQYQGISGEGRKPTS